MKDFFIGIDSDGCVFDSMEVKHKECFCPAFINALELQSISKYAREVWDFVNLYSMTRGANRFIALTRALDLLRERKEIKERNIVIPPLDKLRKWTENEPKLGMKALEEELKKNPHPDLQLALNWSVEVNENVKRIFRNVSPFSAVAPTLKAMKEKACINVISQTPLKNIKNEWTEQGIIEYTDFIAGQEMGTKAQQLKDEIGEQYAPDKSLMLGDAPGDYEAAKANGILFYPIIPGREEESWKELLNEGLTLFFNQKFEGDYEKEKYSEFLEALPSKPPW